MADINALYPQAPAPGSAVPSLLQNPMAAVGMMQQIQQLRARNAIGQAFQGAVGSDGSFDPNAAALAIKTNPAAAYGAPEGITSVLAARGQNIANSTNQLGLNVANNQAAAGILASIAQKPKPTMEDVYNAGAAMARAGVDPGVISGWIGGTSPSNLKDRLGAASAYAMGPAAAAGRVSAPPDATGAPQQTSTGALGFGGPTVPVAMPPGAAEALKANQDEFVADQSASAKTLANVRPLQQALPLVMQLSQSNFGPTSPEFTKVKATLAALGIIDPSTSDGAVRQEVGKYLLRYAAGAQQAGRSDQALSAAIGSNPNPDTMMQPATVALIKNQIGMDRMDAALPLAAPADRSSYKDFKSNYYQNNDPRAFSIDLMSPAEISKLQTTLKGPERDKFNRSLQIAIKSGMIQPPPWGQQ